MSRIRHRLNYNTIAKGEQSIKELAEKNKANLQDADLRGTNLQGADLRGANLQDADLPDADLRSANLQGANLRSADLRGANLQGADLRSADLRSANLQDADLRSADLRGANLRSADLRGTNLQGTDLRSADLRGANLRGANLRSADIKFPYFPSISLLTSITLINLPDNLILELMRRDAYAHPHPERFDKWAKGGECPFQNEIRTWWFLEKRELWRKGKPQMRDSDLMIEICKSQGWKISGYLE